MKVIVRLVLLAYLAMSVEGNRWSTRRTNCGVSVWSEWSAWSAPAPGGTRTRTREIVRSPRNGGSPCPTLTETASRADPWSRQGVQQKFHNKFMTGHTHYYSFIPDSSRAVGLVEVPNRGAHVLGGGDGGVTLLPRDLLFMIDMSGSISSSDWTTTKQKLAELIERLCGSIGRGPQNNRIAIITFSSRVVLNFNFKAHWTIDSVKNAILAMPQARGSTCTGDAFEYARQYMFEPDTGIRSATESVKEVLVLTDGHSNCGAALPNAVRRLQVKAFVFALAIGDYGISGKAEIESMVSRPLIDHIFSLANFIEFRNMVNEILQYPDKCAPFELK
ncbi:integrin alpha-X-like [Liolophura sinensis]|uniref:integrin alpha-X-like n=1 Tax=Liolophura sinensis TaxID=3198878 RepID=UPI003158F119